MKNEIKNLKASLEVIRDYAKEAENLVTQINKESKVSDAISFSIV